jgi:hypothetical protein
MKRSTGHRLPSRQPDLAGVRNASETRRYSLKARLQSLLIRDFRAQLAVEAMPGPPGVVALRYVPADRDACHAVIDELDEGARSWVRLNLDLGIAGREPQPEAHSPRQRAAPAQPEEGGTSPAELLRRGGSALESYDFEQARELFVAAFDALIFSHGLVRPGKVFFSKRCAPTPEGDAWLGARAPRLTSK